jgi:hypothetical protein
MYRPYIGRLDLRETLGYRKGVWVELESKGLKCSLHCSFAAVCVTIGIHEIS